jgi:hypothetical protein
MKKIRVTEIARALGLRTSSNADYQELAESRIEDLMKTAPSGSGFDAGTKFDYEKSFLNKLVFTTSFHHLSDNGYYTGWTDHMITVTPDFRSGFDLKVSGRDRNNIKEYIADTFHTWLSEEVGE